MEEMKKQDELTRRKHSPRPPNSPPPNPSVSSSPPPIDEATRKRYENRLIRMIEERYFVAIFLLSIVVIGVTRIFLTGSFLREDLFFGFTNTDRLAVIDSFPKTPEGIQTVKTLRREAVTTIYKFGPDKTDTVRIGDPKSLQQTDPNGVQHDAFKHLLSQKFMYGLAAENGDDKLELRRLLIRVDPKPLALHDCTFENKAGNWFKNGTCVVFSSQIDQPAMEQTFQIVALKFRQPAFYKWWLHVWGSDEAKHSTLMQMVYPSASSVNSIKTSIPVSLLSKDDV